MLVGSAEVVTKNIFEQREMRIFLFTLGWHAIVVDYFTGLLVHARTNQQIHIAFMRLLVVTVYMPINRNLCNEAKR